MQNLLFRSCGLISIEAVITKKNALKAFKTNDLVIRGVRD